MSFSHRKQISWVPEFIYTKPSIISYPLTLNRHIRDGLETVEDTIECAGSPQTLGMLTNTPFLQIVLRDLQLKFKSLC